MEKINLEKLGPARDESEKEQPAKDKSTLQPVASPKTYTENPAQDALLDTMVDPDWLPTMLGSDQGRIIDWDSPQDPKNPQNWTDARKWMIILLVSAITFNQLYCIPIW